MLKIMKPTKNSTSGTFILLWYVLHCTGHFLWVKLGHQSGGSFFMFHDHFVTLWLHYFQHDPYTEYFFVYFNYLVIYCVFVFLDPSSKRSKRSAFSLKRKTNSSGKYSFLNMDLFPKCRWYPTLQFYIHIAWTINEFYTL